MQSRTRSTETEEELVSLSNPELARLERENRRAVRERAARATMPPTILVRNAAGELVDPEGNKYNAQFQRLDADGNVIPERAEQILDPHAGNGDQGGNRALSLAEYNRPDQFYVNRSAIVPPPFDRNDFEFRIPYYTYLAQNPFHGLPNEYAMDHIEMFERVAGGLKANGVSSDFIHLQLFPHSLAGDALSWLNSLPAGSFTTWEAVRRAFLRYFYDDSKTEELRSKILNFKQGPKEAFKAAWLRYTKYQRDCPHHGYAEQQLLTMFFKGVELRYQASLDSASNGNFMTRSAESARELIENLTQSSSTRAIDEERAKDGSGTQEDVKELKASIANLMSMMQGKQVSYVEQNNGVPTGGEVNFVGNGQFQQKQFQNNGFQNQNQNRNFAGSNFKMNNGYLQNQQLQNQGQGNFVPANDPYMDMLNQIFEGQVRIKAEVNEKIESSEATLRGEIETVKLHMKKLDTQVAQVTNAVNRQVNNQKECKALDCVIEEEILVVGEENSTLSSPSIDGSLGVD